MIEKFFFEKSPKINTGGANLSDETSVNEKYEMAYSRVITENGSYKVALINSIFSQSNYELQPEYQRRITWNTKKRSKLIESLVINIPIPPIFLYEYDFDKYEIMDGLQRISTIIDFYKDKFKLTGLEEWPELNGKKYSNLPEKIREGIDRRQIQVITLLKESATNKEHADKIRRLVFERLNTGGVKLQGQEIRNAIFNGDGNRLCYKLSENPTFRLLWGIPDPSDFSNVDEDDADETEIQTIEDEKLRKKLEKHSLYKRMYDVELVLRFFAMRFVEDYNYSLTEFFDDTLINLNSYSHDELATLEDTFIKTIDNAYALFGENAFMYFDGEKWSSPSKMIYDPMMQVLSDIRISRENVDIPHNLEMLKAYYSSTVTNDEERLFDGKHQSKNEIIARMNSLKSFIKTLL